MRGMNSADKRSLRQQLCDRFSGHCAYCTARVANGRAAFGRRFVMPYYGSGSGTTGRSLDRPIGTLTTRARWAVVDGPRMRMVSVPEAVAFMGFPPTTRLPASAVLAHHLLGNAMPPPLARTVLQQLRRHL